jgi:hypothetical protein
MINDRIERVLGTVDKCLETSETLCVSDNASARADDCDAMVLGSYLRELQKLGVLPRSKNWQIHESMSVSDLAHVLRSMNIRGPHQQCRKALFERIGLVGFRIFTVLDPVLEAHRRHMKRQGEGRIMT